MANYYASARTNYFQVKNMQSFMSEIEGLDNGLAVHSKDDSPKSSEPGNEDMVCILANCEGGWPSCDQDYNEIDWPDFFQRHLLENHVAIVMESGAEKLRYIIGHSTAYTWDGRIVEVSISDIYAKVRSEIGSVEMTECEY